MRVILCLLTALVATPAWAGPKEDAATANSKGDYAAELRITRPLAADGEAWAQSLIGLSYSTGEGVPKNDAEAVKWYRLAAAQGDSEAQSQLAFHYSLGRGVPRDDGRAHMWANLAAANGDVISATLRDLIAEEMTPKQLAEAQKLARECQARNFKGCD